MKHYTLTEEEYYNQLPLVELSLEFLTPAMIKKIPRYDPDKKPKAWAWVDEESDQSGKRQLGLFYKLMYRWNVKQEWKTYFDTTTMSEKRHLVSKDGTVKTKQDFIDMMGYYLAKKGETYTMRGKTIKRKVDGELAGLSYEDCMEIVKYLLAREIYLQMTDPFKSYRFEERAKIYRNLGYECRYCTKHNLVYKVIPFRSLESLNLERPIDVFEIKQQTRKFVCRECYTEMKFGVHRDQLKTTEELFNG